MDDKARKEKLKQERKELRKAKKLERQRRLEEQEDKNPLKFKEWFSLKGILGVYFYGADALIALILKTLGLS